MVIMHLEFNNKIVLVAENKLNNTFKTVGTEHGVE